MVSPYVIIVHIFCFSCTLSYGKQLKISPQSHREINREERKEHEDFLKGFLSDLRVLSPVLFRVAVQKISMFSCLLWERNPQITHLHKRWKKQNIISVILVKTSGLSRGIDG